MIDFLFHYLHRGAHQWSNWYWVEGDYASRRDCLACERYQQEFP